MQKLIFLRNGMLIDYYDNLIECEEYKNNTHTIIDSDICTLGFKEIERRLKETDEYNQFEYLITTCPALLDNDRWWNDETSRWEIYFVENKELKSIHEYTDKWLRQAHNIEKLYLNGGLDI